jgi:murein DD-endopeptidase MepM/ murein hydrolase activator NlpD
LAATVTVWLIWPGSLAVAAHPWPARHLPVTPPAAHQLADISRWPAEPLTPPVIDPVRFGAAVEHLCGKDKLVLDQAAAHVPPPTPTTDVKVDADADADADVETGPSAIDLRIRSARGQAASTDGPLGLGYTAAVVPALPVLPEVVAPAPPLAPGAGAAPVPAESTVTTTAASPSGLGTLVLAAAREAGVDAFLLAGLMLEQSRCRERLETRWGYGLLGIHPALYQSPGAPPPPGPREWWRKPALLDPATNLRLGALLLEMWQESHERLDAEFHGVPHRGGAAHFIWGDVVRGSGGEDQVLTARRRLLADYASRPEPVVATSLGLPLLCPLEGTPRVASSGPGEDRAGGKRQHQGIDLGAAIGEPVRSVADGTVIFAGVNLASAPRRSLTPAAAARYRWKRLGAGGIYVCVEHAPQRHVVSCYMHLDSYVVNEGDVLRAGQILGRVGRTGVQVSPPHLHFELRVDDRHVNPVRYLGDLIIPPKATQTYRYAIRAKRTRLARMQSQQVGLETAAVR